MEERVIIHPNGSGGVCVVSPNYKCGISVEEIARKDVPEGVPYKIIDRSQVPEDLEGYSPSFDSHDGIGVGHKKWFAERGITI